MTANGSSARFPFEPLAARWESSLHVEPLTAAAVHAWLIKIDEGLRSSSEHLLSEAEMRRAAAFKFARDRTQFVVARACLRLFLGKYTGQPPQEIEFAYGEYGKPYLETGRSRPLQFNLSHSGDYAVAAFAVDQEVGVDIEQHAADSLDEGLLTFCFTESERTKYDQAFEGERTNIFFDTWARKEAYMKFVGDGLNIEANKLDIAAREKEISITDLPQIHGYSAAIATNTKPVEVRCYDFASSNMM